MNKKITKTLLLIILLILLIGVTSATTVSDNTTSNKAMKKTVNTTNIEVENNHDKIIEKKATHKENKNKKTSTYTVNDFSTLNNRLSTTTDSDLTINLGKNITLTKNMTINNNIKKLTINGNYHTINGQNKYQFINFVLKSDLTIKNIEIINCKGEMGGAVEAREISTVNIINSRFSQNNAEMGGAIYHLAGNLNIINSMLYNNHAIHGGALFDEGFSETRITKSTFFNNKAEKKGGAVIGVNLTIINSTFIKNNVYGTKIDSSTSNSYCGGAIITIYKLDIRNSNFTENSATLYGGAIYGDLLSEIIISNSKFLKNSILTKNNEFEDVGGGAIYLEKYSNLTSTNCTYTNNTAEYGNGGAAYCNILSNINMIQTTLKENYAFFGGAMYIKKSILLIRNSNINNNTAGLGGAICTDNGNTTIIQTKISNNYASRGGVIDNNGNLILTNNNFSNNVADIDDGLNGQGGVINSEEGNININKCNFTQNKGYHGGVLYGGSKCTVYIDNSNFIKNTARNGGVSATSNSLLLI